MKYSLLYRDDAEITTSIVDVETVTDQPIVPGPDEQYSPDVVMPVKNSSPEPTIRTNSGDLTPCAKRCRRSQFNYGSSDCVTPPRPSPLKDFSIVLSDSLKSPMRSPIIMSPGFGNKHDDNLSPKRCAVILHDITKSPLNITTTSPETLVSNGNKRTVRSASVSPEQRRISRDPLMGSPAKEKADPSPSNVHTITDVSKYLHQSRDVLLVSSPQITPQK